MSDWYRTASEAMATAAAVPAAWLAEAFKNLGMEPAPTRPLSGPGVLINGDFYPVRTLTEDDADALHDFLQNELGEESRRLRFMAPMPTVPESAAAWLAARDGHDRVALAALDPGDPSKVVAVVEYAAVPAGPPEVAVAVADRLQGKGIGSNLLGMLATLSLASGQKYWSCDVLADNEGPIRLLERVGTVHLGDVRGGVRAVIVELDPSRLFGMRA